MLLDTLMKIFGRNEKPSGKIAKERLRVVLIHDRASVSPEVMERLKNDIIAVISKYMDVNQKEMEISLPTRLRSSPTFPSIRCVTGVSDPNR